MSGNCVCSLPVRPLTQCKIWDKYGYLPNCDLAQILWPSWTCWFTRHHPTVLHRHRTSVRKYRDPLLMLNMFLSLYRPRIALKREIWHLEITSMFSHVKPCYPTFGSEQLLLNNMNRTENWLNFNLNINPFPFTSHISYFRNQLSWYYTNMLSCHIFKILSISMTNKQQLLSIFLWILRVEPMGEGSHTDIGDGGRVRWSC